MVGVCRQVKIGGGGFLTGLSASSDGATLVMRCDVHNGYIWEPGAGVWRPLITDGSIPSDAPQWPDCWSGVTEVAVAPIDANRIYMMWMGRVWRSNNRGIRWLLTSSSLTYGTLAEDSANNGQPVRWMGQKMAVDPNNPDIVYVGTPTAGVMRTFDGGVSWEQISTSSIPACVTTYGGQYPGHPGICFDPASGTTRGRTNTIYVPVYGGGVYRSTDAGATWALLTGGPTLVKHAKVHTDGVYYAAQIAGVNANTLYRWNGAWAAVGSTARASESVICDPANAARIIALFDDGSLCLSGDRGATWGARITFSRSSPDIPWLDWTYEPFLSVADGLMIGTTLWIAQGLGAWNTPFSGSPASVTYTGKSKGIENLTGNSVVCPPGGKPMFAVWDRSCFRINDPEVYPSTHAPYPTNDKQIRMGWDVDYASSDPNFIAYPSAWGSIDAGDQDSRFGWKSTDGGVNWIAFATSPGATGTIPLRSGNNWLKSGGCIACSTPNNIVIIPSNNSLPWRTKDGGSTWAECVIAGVPTTGESGFGFAYYNTGKFVAADRVAANTFYAVNYSTKKCYRTIDGGDNWTTRNAIDLPPSMGGTNLKLIAVPGQEGHLFLAGGREGNPGDASPGSTRLLRSTDGGATWSVVSNVAEPYCVAPGKAAPGGSYPAVYFVGWYSGTYGIWRSTDNGVSFENIGRFPASSMDWIDGIAASMEEYGLVYFAAYGNSLFYRNEAMQYGRL